MNFSTPFLLFISFLLSATLPYTSIAAPLTPVGKVEEVNGKKSQVKIIRQSQIKQAFRNDPLVLKDITQTGNLSTSKLSLTKKEHPITIFVFENSKFKISPAILHKKRKSTVVELSQGIISILAKKLRPNEDVRIKTPNAVVGIRGSFVTVLVAQDKRGKSETSILQSSGDIKILPANLAHAPLTTQNAVTVPEGTMATVQQTDTATVALKTIAPTSPTNTSVMLDTNVTATFKTGQELDSDDVDDGDHSTEHSQDEHETEDSTKEASDQSTSGILGDASTTANTLSLLGVCH